MSRRTIAAALAIALSLQAACAKTALISVTPENRTEMRNAARLHITMNDGRKYEMQDFSVTDSTIVGNAFVHEGGLIQMAKVTTIDLRDVKTIQMQTENQTAYAAFIGGIFAGLALALLAVVIICSSAN